MATVGRKHRQPRDRGSVTAELALGLPAVVLALVVVLLVASAAIAQVRCTDAARAAARAAALGEDSATVVAIATDLAGSEAHVSVSESGGWVTVEVSRPVATGWLGGSSLTARAEVAVPAEPGEP
ncbi:TadE family type IV pilus minor pilin [Pseudactinotalea sp.]|uniref:TadE family type IV pilus minor pilin n=1 Tax=Pseudactinotalea sp. TaxID=1926260 RepID=UPI003B3B53FD